MALVSLQQFKEDYWMLDEACRQWYAFIEEDRSRADGVGFGEFYEELCRIKYREYLQNPDDFYEFKPAYPVFLALSKEQTEALANVLEERLCDSSALDNEEVLNGISQKLNQFTENEERMELLL